MPWTAGVEQGFECNKYADSLPHFDGVVKCEYMIPMMVYFQPASMLVTEMTTLVSRKSTFPQVWATIGGATAVIAVFVAMFFTTLGPGEMDPDGPVTQYVFRMRPNKSKLTKLPREKFLSKIHDELLGKNEPDKVAEDVKGVVVQLEAL
jgi:hypothetical protein